MPQRIEAEQDLGAQRANLRSISAAINEIIEQRKTVHAEAQRVFISPVKRAVDESIRER